MILSLYLSPSILSSSLLLLVAITICGILAIVIYNLYFHPYSKYPGPFLARITSFYSLWHAYKGDLHLDVLRCHDKYGPYVRYGPSRLIVNTTTGMKAIYGHGKNFKKSKGYAPHPYFPTVSNTHNTINKATHRKKRRIVSQGFSEDTLASSEPYILEHVHKLCRALVSNVAEKSNDWSSPRDMAMWTNYFTLDVVSDLTFGRAFNLISNPELRWIIDAIVAGNRHIYMRFACPWLFNFPPNRWWSPARWLFPNMGDERNNFTDIADQYSQERMQAEKEGKQERKDILSSLLAARDPKTGEKLSEAELWCEAHLMIAAGGDTTSTAFAAVLFYLSRDPSRYAKLTAEICTSFSGIDQIKRGPQLSACRYLRACIDEALRLAPAAPGTLWRESGDGGAFIDDEYIPAGLDVGTCTYALSHSSKYFGDPYAFRPERFMPADTASTRTEVNDLNAYAPFSIGPRSCLAKPLAYLELSLALAAMIWLLDFEAVDSTGEGSPSLGEGRWRKEEFQIIDMFSSNKNGPVLRFRRRFRQQ